MAGQPGVSGYVLAGLGTGESREQRQQIVQAVLQKLPAGAPRMLSSVGTPEEVLEAVAQVRGWAAADQCWGLGTGRVGSWTSGQELRARVCSPGTEITCCCEPAAVNHD